MLLQGHTDIFKYSKIAGKENTTHCTWKMAPQKSPVDYTVHVCPEEQQDCFSSVKWTCCWPSVFSCHWMRLKTVSVCECSVSLGGCLARKISPSQCITYIRICSYEPDTLGFHGYSAVLCSKHGTKRNQKFGGRKFAKTIYIYIY